MKKLVAATICSLALLACAPVLNRELMEQGLREVPLSAVREAPDAYKGKLFILGGVIVETRLTEKGSQIEALSVPVSRLGYLRDEIHARDGRFLAIYPRERGFLEPLIYKKGREITLAGELVEVRRAKLDEVEYAYPVFVIRQVHLWEERRDYYYAPYYYYYPYPYWWYDPWWRPYPYYWPPPPGW